jgi:ribosomal protein S12 methylthiotransferase accessory factor
MDAYLLDLSRPQFVIPVVRVVAPGLQIEPSSIISSRLQNARHENRHDASRLKQTALI